MTELQLWSIISLAVGFFAGFCFGHLDGRTKAYENELRRFRSYTKRAQSILARAQHLKGSAN